MMKNAIACTLLATVSLAAQALTVYDVEGTPKSLFRSVSGNNQQVSIAYVNSREVKTMPAVLQSIPGGSAARIKITVPPGVQFSGIHAESGIWGNTRTGVVYDNTPYCASPQYRPASGGCDDSNVANALNYVYPADFQFDGYFNNIFPSPADVRDSKTTTTSESTVYAWIANQDARGNVGLMTFTVSYLIADAALYNAWVGDAPPIIVDPPETTPALVFLSPVASMTGVKASTASAYHRLGTFPATTNVDIQFTFTPPSGDVGKTVDLFTVATFDDLFFARTQDNGANHLEDFTLWQTPSLQLENIPKLRTVTLTSQPVTIQSYQGVIPLPGSTLAVYAGYRYANIMGAYQYRLFSAPVMLDITE